MVESSLVGRNFVPGICKLKPKNLKPYFFVKTYQPCTRVHEEELGDTHFRHRN